MAVGVGEASFVALAAPYVDDHAPPGKRTAWLAVFYLQIPVGVAAGYVFGGVLGPWLGWRAAFLLEALLMLPFLLFCLTAPPLPLKGGVDAPAVEPAVGPDAAPAGALAEHMAADIPQGSEEKIPLLRPAASETDGVSPKDERCRQRVLAGHSRGVRSGDGHGHTGRDNEGNTAAVGVREGSGGEGSARRYGDEETGEAGAAEGRADGDGGAVVWAPEAGSSAGQVAALAARIRVVSQSFWEDVVETWSHPVYAATVLGATCWTAVLGVYAFWGNKAGSALFALPAVRSVAGAWIAACLASLHHAWCPCEWRDRCVGGVGVAVVRRVCG